MTMQGRVQHLLLCMSVAALLVMPCCNAARTREFASGPRSVISSISAAEDDTEVPRNDPGQEAPPSAMGRENQVNKWASFQVQEVAIDYNPAAANPDPGNPFPIGD